MDNPAANQRRDRGNSGKIDSGMIKCRANRAQSRLPSIVPRENLPPDHAVGKSKKRQWSPPIPGLYHRGWPAPGVGVAGPACRSKTIARHDFSNGAN
jgi:hypothetical protein